MNTLLASQFTIHQCGEKYYTKTAFAHILARYAGSFGKLTLCVPFRQAATPDAIWVDVSDAVAGIVPVSRNEALVGAKKRTLRKAIRCSDLVIVRLHSFIGLEVSELAHRLGKPVLAEVMSCPLDGLWNHGFSGKVLAPAMFLRTKRALRSADYAVYVTEHFLQQRYPCPNPSLAASNVALRPAKPEMPDHRFEKTIEQRGDELTLMTCAAVDVRYKGQVFVIRAIPLLNDLGIRVKYYCAGQGDPAYLAGEARRLGVEEQVIFTGVIPHNQIFDLLERCDIYVQPSLQEGLPRAMIEAMSCACPCVGAHTGGIPELLPEECIAERASARSIAQCIVHMLETGLAPYAADNFQRAKDFLPELLETRRSAFFDRIREEVLGDRNG